MENGVRELNRKIAGVCRTVAYRYAISEDKENFAQVVVDNDTLKEALGSPIFD